MTAAERRARLVRRHHLTPATRIDSAVDVARDLVALHATDPASVFLAEWARLREPSVQAIESALYEERQLVRILAMRRTVFVVPVELAPVVHAAATRAVAAKQRQTYLKYIEQAGLGDGHWLADIEAGTLKALRSLGSAFGAELTRAEPRLGQRMVRASGKSYQSEINLTSWVLLLMAAEGKIVRGRPRGSWVSSQFRWYPMEAWLPAGLGSLPVEAAQAGLARRWLAAFGPGTGADLRWWTGWTAGETQRALAAAGAVQVDLEGNPGFLLADDFEVEAPVEPAIALLPALDPTIMGWAGRDWYLGAHGPSVFDRSGNPCATVWWDGRVVGAWAQRKDGRIAYRLFEDLGADANRQLESEAARLGAWIGEVRIAPRTRIPPAIEKELVA